LLGVSGLRTVDHGALPVPLLLLVIGLASLGDRRRCLDRCVVVAPPVCNPIGGH
jgi:hypothetical protein